MNKKSYNKKPIFVKNSASLGLLFNRTVLHYDLITKKNFDVFSGHVGTRAGLVFDAHPGWVDIFGIGSVLRKTEWAQELVVPVAASFFYNPVYLRFFRQMKESFTLFPVYRKEEHDYTDRKVVNFSRATKPEMKDANRKYMQVAMEALTQPGSIVLVAPYGGTSVQKEWLRSGVKKMIKKDIPVLFTLSKFNLWKFRYEVYVGGCYFFQEDEVTSDYLHAVCVKEYSLLQERIGTDLRLFEPEKQSPVVLALVRLTQFFLLLTHPW